jgi:hypothetical protein
MTYLHIHKTVINLNLRVILPLAVTLSPPHLQDVARNIELLRTTTTMRTKDLMRPLNPMISSELQEFTMPSPDDVRFGSSPDFQRWHFTPTSHPTTATGQGEFEPQRHPTTLSLNQKQFLVVRKILSHAIKRHGKLTLEAEDQMLLAVAGGKTRVIKAPTTSVVVPSTPP